MQITVTKDNFWSCLEQIPASGEIGFDLETTDLRPHAGGKIFGLAMAFGNDELYFDFGGRYRDGLLPDDYLEYFREVFAVPTRLWAAHNAKFDLGYLDSAAISVVGAVWCTQTMARVERNDHMLYNLDACLKRIGMAKDDAVKVWLDKNKAFTWSEIEGKKTRIKNYEFDRAPLQLIAPYAMKDARGTLRLYQGQNQTFQDIERQKTRPIFPLVKTEIAVTKIVTRMERRGIQIDRDYCEKAANFERLRVNLAKAGFSDMTGSEFVDSAKALGPILKKHGIDPGKTEKGNDSFTDAVLRKHAEHPLVAKILQYRDANKRLGTYWSSFLYFSQWDGRIHCSLNVAGTATGRFSSSEPNLQNLTDDEKSDTPYPIRRAFIPDQGHLLWSADYKQMEYRMMLEYAEEQSVIAEVLAGKDLHQACADLMGVDRGTAKTINFMLLYGGGTQKLADELKVSFERAQELRNLYFSVLPKVRKFVKSVMECAERRGYIFNWKGRRYQFSDPSFAYKSPNYLIQGGGSDVMRVAMIEIDHKVPVAKLQVQIHDELIGQIRHDDLDLLAEVKRHMIEAFPHRFLPMDVGLAISERSLHDLEDLVL